MAESNRDNPPSPVQTQREPLDYSPASGATDPEHAAQDQSTMSQVGRFAYMDNTTSIGGHLDAKSDRWRSLNDANRDFAGGDGEDIHTKQRELDCVNDTRAWGHRIGLMDWEVGTAAQLVRDADRGYLNNHGSETVILAALTLAANVAPVNRPSEQKELRSSSVFAGQSPVLRDNYEELRKSLDVSRRGVKACRQHLRDFL